MSESAWTIQMWSDRSPASSSLAAACEQLGAHLVFRPGPSDPAQAPQLPALLVAGLPAGERSLPADLVEQLDARSDLSLLLLCEEALVRPTLSIQEGRIVLLEPPFTASRIEARLRLLMTARCVDSAGCFRPTAAPAEALSGVPHEHYRTADYWFAVFMSTAPGPSRVPSWRAHARQGLSWTLSEPSIDDAAERAWAPLAKTTLENSDMEQGLRNLLGLDAALVQLDPAQGLWRFLLPDDGSLLRVFSYQRLPRAWHAGKALARCNSRFFRLAAAPGDVVCLMTASLRGQESALERSALDGGGPALLHTLVTQCSPSSPGVTAGVVVEVM